MPIEISTFQLPSGGTGLLMVTSGHLSREDVEGYFRQVGPGGPMHRLPRLCLTQKQESVSAEARSMFLQHQKEEQPWVATVVVNPLIRVAINFVLRIGQNKKVRLFTDEQEAVRWLDDRVREDAARARGPQD